jgi:nanoRNase/pAp phosphatase (c-di-AMP/oligoRNAs hydrolase)
MKTLFDFLKKDKPTAIIVHNNPDPDSLASAMALRFILNKKGFKRVNIYFDGIIGRAENQEMIQILKIKLHRSKNLSLSKKMQCILVDCQPFSGNVTLPDGVSPIAVIDHHPLRKETSARIPFYDVRPAYGACAAILYEYINSLKIPIAKNIATALCYAILSETQSLGRSGSEADKKAYIELLPYINFKHLSSIQYPDLSKEFISHLSYALLNTFHYKNLVVTLLDQLPYPDFAAQMADFLLRIINITWSLCLGTHDNILYISIRTTNIHADASKVIKKIIPKPGTAGGHSMIAGAQIKIDDKEKDEIVTIKNEIIKRMLKTLNHSDAAYLIKLETNEKMLLS